jgi:hypothetical protein
MLSSHWSKNTVFLCFLIGLKILSSYSIFTTFFVVSMFQTIIGLQGKIKTRQRKTRQNTKSEDKTRQDTCQDKTTTRQDKTRQDEARRDKTRQPQDNRKTTTRQDNHKIRQDKIKMSMCYLFICCTVLLICVNLSGFALRYLAWPCSVPLICLHLSYLVLSCHCCLGFYHSASKKSAIGMGAKWKGEVSCVVSSCVVLC